MFTKLNGIALLAAACAIAAASPQPAGWDAVVAGYRAALARSGIAGSSLLVVRDGEIVARAAEGTQNRDTREPVTADTIFHWAIGI